MSRIYDEIREREAKKARENPAPDYSGLSFEEALGAAYDDIQKRVDLAGANATMEPIQNSAAAQSARSHRPRSSTMPHGDYPDAPPRYMAIGDDARGTSSQII